MKWKQKSRWATPSDLRTQASTGSRVSGGRYKPSSPKGGFYDAGYQAAKDIGRYFGYDPEGYVYDRLLGTKPENLQWRSKNLYGRDIYDRRVPPWLPRFPKKKWPKSSSAKFQESYSLRGRQLWRRFQQPSYSYGNRFRSCRPNWKNGYKCSNRKYRKVLRSPIRRKQCYRCASIHQLHHSVHTKWSKFRRS